MSKFKSLLLLCVLCASALNSQAQWANGFAVTTIMNGGTNVVGLTTNTYNAGVLTANRSEHLAIAVQYTFFAAPVGVTPTVILRLNRSLDGSNWETAVPIILTMSGATNTCTWVTNVVVGSVPYLRLQSIENTNSAVLTNVFLWAGVKR